MGLCIWTVTPLLLPGPLGSDPKISQGPCLWFSSQARSSHPPGHLAFAASYKGRAALDSRLAHQVEALMTLHTVPGVL